MYKLIAMDMDGTLLNEQKIISEKTKAAIMKAKQKGVKIVLASGRPLEGIERYLEELYLKSGEDYVLSFNGCLVQNTVTKEIIMKKTLKGKDLHYLYEISKNIGVNIHAFSKEGCITPNMTKYSEVEGEINGIAVQIVDYATINENEDITKIMMVDEPDILEKAIKELPKVVYDKYTVVRSAPYFLEFLNKEGNKGAGIKALAEHLGIKEQEVICIGDAGNDLHMIEYAGLGVAMGNAFEEVKEIANYITKTNEEDGIVEVIEKFIL